MTHYDVTIDSISYASSSTVTINPGDSMALKGTFTGSSTSLKAYGLVSSTTGPGGLIGDYPPESPKDLSHWQKIHPNRNRIFEAISTITFLTPGTYTFTKGYQTNFETVTGGVATIKVRSLTPDIPVKVSGAWKNATASIKVSGSWKGVSEAYVNVSGTWKKI